MEIWGTDAGIRDNEVENVVGEFGVPGTKFIKKQMRVRNSFLEKKDALKFTFGKGGLIKEMCEVPWFFSFLFVYLFVCGFFFFFL